MKEGVLPGPTKLHSKAATVFERAQDEKHESDRAIALVSACALAASEENARGRDARDCQCTRGKQAQPWPTTGRDSSKYKETSEAGLALT